MNLFSFKTKMSGLEWWSKNSMITDEIKGMNLWEFATKGIYDSLIDIDSDVIPFQKFSDERKKIRFELILLAHQQIAKEDELIALHEGLELFCKQQNIGHLLDSESAIIYNYLLAHFSYQLNDSTFNKDENKILRKCDELIASKKALSITQKIENRKGVSNLIKEGYFFGTYCSNILGILNIDIQNRPVIEGILKADYRFGNEKLKNVRIIQSA